MTPARRLASAVLRHGVLIAAAIVTLVPILWMITSALKTTEDAFDSLFLPRGDGLFGVAWDRLTLGNFARLFDEARFGGAIINSLFLASVSRSVFFCESSGCSVTNASPLALGPY